VTRFYQTSRKPAEPGVKRKPNKKTSKNAEKASRRKEKKAEKPLARCRLPGSRDAF